MLMADTPSVEKIQKDLEDLKCHIKTYSTGAYPAFFLQLHSVLKIQDIINGYIRLQANTLFKLIWSLIKKFRLLPYTEP